MKLNFNVFFFFLVIRDFLNYAHLPLEERLFQFYNFIHDINNKLLLIILFNFIQYLYNTIEILNVFMCYIEGNP